MTISLDLPDVAFFVRDANKIQEDIYVKQGRACVNGKSLFGIYSLNLLAPMTVECDNKEFLQTIEKWRVEDVEDTL